MGILEDMEKSMEIFEIDWNIVKTGKLKGILEKWQNCPKIGKQESSSEYACENGSVEGNLWNSFGVASIKHCIEE